MSLDIVAKVKEFLLRLVRDQAFQQKLANCSDAERQELLKESGYYFCKATFEDAIVELLESKDRGELSDVEANELAAVFGGQIVRKYPFPVMVAMYGVAIVQDPVLVVDPSQPIIVRKPIVPYDSADA